jgi:GT2 family glycosyltransferase
MMFKASVSIVIITWKNNTHLFSCLDKISVQAPYLKETIIVDNNPKDTGKELLLEKYPSLGIHIKKLNSNLGFATANNIGAQMARGKWIAFLNADAFPEPDWLENLLKAAQENPGYSFFSSRQIQANSPELLDGAGDAYHVSGLAWRNGYNLPSMEYGSEQKEVFSACAAAALISREEFLSIDGFDEDFFSYYEDVDLGFRLRLQGKKCLYVPGAIVHHVGSASTGKQSDFSVYYGYRNMIWTFFKNMPSPLVWILIPVHITTLLFFILYLSLRGQGKIILRAVIDALRELPKMVTKRKEIQRNIKINPFELLKVMSTGLFDPYREFILRLKAK